MLVSIVIMKFGNGLRLNMAQPYTRYPENDVRIIRAKNLNAVRRYYAEHLGCRPNECAEALGLGRKTVYRHVLTLRKEWEEETK